MGHGYLMSFGIGDISCEFSICCMAYWVILSWNFLNWSLSLGLLLHVPSTSLKYYTSHLNVNGVDLFVPYLPVLFLFLFLPSPESNPPILPVVCSWFPWIKLKLPPCQDVVVGVSDVEIIFVSREWTLSVTLEVLLKYVNYILTDIPLMEILIYFTILIHCIWDWCYFCSFF